MCSAALPCPIVAPSASAPASTTAVLWPVSTPVVTTTLPQADVHLSLLKYVGKQFPLPCFLSFCRIPHQDCLGPEMLHSLRTLNHYSHTSLSLYIPHTGDWDGDRAYIRVGCVLGIALYPEILLKSQALLLSLVYHARLPSLTLCHTSSRSCISTFLLPSFLLSLNSVHEHSSNTHPRRCINLWFHQ